jgi:hypothetical protein
LKHADISEVLTASIIIAVMVEAVDISETLVYFKRLYGAMSQKAAIFILAAVRS